jgi:PAS domain-containing protein
VSSRAVPGVGDDQNPDRASEQLNEKFGSALYRVASLKQRAAVSGDSSRVVEQLLKEVETLTLELERAFEDLRQTRLEYAQAKEGAAIVARRAQLLFEITPTPCLILEDDGVIADVNPAASELLNVSVRHLAGRPLELFVGADRTEFLHKLHELQRDQPQRWTITLRPRERSPQPIVVTGVLDDTGQSLLILQSPQGQTGD